MIRSAAHSWKPSSGIEAEQLLLKKKLPARGAYRFFRNNWKEKALSSLWCQRGGLLQQSTQRTEWCTGLAFSFHRHLRTQIFGSLGQKGTFKNTLILWKTSQYFQVFYAPRDVSTPTTSFDFQNSPRKKITVHFWVQKRKLKNQVLSFSRICIHYTYTQSWILTKQNSRHFQSHQEADTRMCNQTVTGKWLKTMACSGWPGLTRLTVNQSL